MHIDAGVPPVKYRMPLHIDGLVQERSNSIALTLSHRFIITQSFAWRETAVTTSLLRCNKEDGRNGLLCIGPLIEVGRDSLERKDNMLQP